MNIGALQDQKWWYGRSV